MVFDRCGADGQIAGDLFVGMSIENGFGHLLLARCQGFEPNLVEWSIVIGGLGQNDGTAQTLAGAHIDGEGHARGSELLQRVKSVGGHGGALRPGQRRDRGFEVFYCFVVEHGGFQCKGMTI